MTVFVAAFVAGAAAAVGVNRALDIHLAQAKPQVECEPIFVALRSLPQGSPVTVWDVALRDWPKAMLPATALRVNDSFEGCLLKHALREGQPLLSVQLLKPEVSQPAPVESPAADVEEELVEEAFVPPIPRTEPVASLEKTPPSAAREPVVEPGREADLGKADTEQSGTEQPETAEASGASAVGRDAPAIVADAAAGDDVPQALSESAAAAPPADLGGEETEPATAADVAATVAGQPTLADPPAEPAPQPPAAAPPTMAAAAQSAPVDQARLAGDIDAAFDMPSRPPVDLSSIPSVVARGDATPPPATEESAAGSTVRYLVVPERIARQADTSFTSPMAPEAQPAPASPEAARSPQRKPATTGQRQAGQRQAGQPRPAGQPRQQQGQQQGRTQPGGSRQSAAGSQPNRTQSQPQAEADRRQQSGQRAWGESFPAISAGLDAIGSWRGRVREAMASEQPADDEPARQRR